MKIGEILMNLKIFLILKKKINIEAFQIFFIIFHLFDFEIDYNSIYIQIKIKLIIFIYKTIIYRI